MSPTKEVEVIDVPEVDMIDELDINSWYRAEGEDIPPVDSDEIQREIVLRIFTATTKEAILQPVTTTPAEEILGVPLEIVGYRRMPSTKKDSRLKYYLLIDAVNGDGERINISCGSINVMARLAALNANGFLPCLAAIVQAKTATANGYFPMDLEGRSAAALKAGDPKASDF